MDKIVIFHAAAIGDTVLATPVSACLRKAYPQAQISYIVHESLLPLLASCPGIDERIGYDKSSTNAELRKLISTKRPDLIVDLSGSSKSFWQTTFLAKKIVRYKKQNPNEKNLIHATTNFLETLKPLGIAIDAPPFPTIFPSETEKNNVRRMLARDDRRLVALVPGVGSLRPHRAWPEDQWVALAKDILWTDKQAIILIGGSEERTLCSRIAEQAGKYCFNLAGKLNLAETAAALSLCDATVSGDTGPAHISIAVGTPTIGLYGPTRLERSGPYGMEAHSISVTDKCKCVNLKSCPLAPEGKSKCMSEIAHREAFGKLEPIIRAAEPVIESGGREDDWGHLG